MNFGTIIVGGILGYVLYKNALPKEDKSIAESDFIAKTRLDYVIDKISTPTLGIKRSKIPIFGTIENGYILDIPITDYRNKDITFEKWKRGEISAATMVKRIRHDAYTAQTKRNLARRMEKGKYLRNMRGEILGINPNYAG